MIVVSLANTWLQARLACGFPINTLNIPMSKQQLAYAASVCRQVTTSKHVYSLFSLATMP